MINGRNKIKGTKFHNTQLNVFLFLGLLAILVGLTGGASRYDAIQVVPLRALSALFIIPALYYITLKGLMEWRMLVTLLALITLLVVIQIVPLPPAVWQGLPGRHELTELDSVLGFEGVWRPLSLAPMRSWNVLGSLIVPAAGLLLAIALRATSRELLQVVASLGVLNAILGLLQVVAGPSSALYFYEITNRGSPVGIFANENHAAIFAACSLLIVASLELRARKFPGRNWERLVYAASFFLILMGALVGGSRAGFAAVIGAMVVSIAMIVLSPRSRKRGSNAPRVRQWVDGYSRLVLLFPIIIVLLTAGAFMALNRTPAFRDILSRDSFNDLRWSLWPVISQILKTHWLLGSGFGSFEQVYKVFEPSELLMPRYVNQAHNDWAQLIIEGGVLAGGLLAWLIVWISKAVITLSSKSRTRIMSLFWMSIFTIVGVASMVDYPLRAPVFQLVMVWLLIALSRDLRDAKAT